VTGEIGCSMGKGIAQGAKANWMIIVIIPIIIILGLKYRRNKYVVGLLVIMGGTAIIIIAMNEAKSTLEYGEAIYYYHNDHLGTPQMMTDDDGDVVWDAAYEPFGKINEFATQTITNNFRFPGQYEDAMTGMYYNHHRYYMPELGRYNRIDPLGWNIFYNKNKLYYIKYDDKQYRINPYKYYLLNPMIHHKYNYAVNQPLMESDPNGESPPIVIISVVVLGVIIIEEVVAPGVHLINDGIANLIDRHFGTPPSTPSVEPPHGNENEHQQWHLEPCMPAQNAGGPIENAPAGAGGAGAGPGSGSSGAGP